MLPVYSVLVNQLAKLNDVLLGTVAIYKSLIYCKCVMVTIQTCLSNLYSPYDDRQCKVDLCASSLMALHFFHCDVLQSKV